MTGHNCRQTHRHRHARERHQKKESVSPHPWNFHTEEQYSTVAVCQWSALPGGSSFSRPDPPDSTERFSKDWKTNQKKCFWINKYETWGRCTKGELPCQSRGRSAKTLKKGLSETWLPPYISYKTCSGKTTKHDINSSFEEAISESCFNLQVCCFTPDLCWATFHILFLTIQGQKPTSYP